KIIRLWNVATRENLVNLTGHSAEIKSVVFSPKEDLLASADADGTIIFWNTTAEVIIQRIAGHSDAVNSIAFFPDGSILGSGSSDNTIKLWNLREAIRVTELEIGGEEIYSVAFSPNGTRLAASSVDKINIWERQNSSVPFDVDDEPFSGHNGKINSVTFSPNGTLLASGGEDTNVSLWNVINEEIVRNLINHTDEIYSLAFAPNGSLLASGSADSTIKLWNLNNGKLIRTLTGHTSTVYSVSFSPDGKVLASGSRDNTVNLWNVTDGNLLNTLTEHDGWIHSLDFSSNGEILVTGSRDTTIRVWNASDGSIIRILPDHESEVYSVTFSSNDRLLASSSFDNTIKLWNVTSGDVIYSFPEETDPTKFVTFSSDDTLLASVTSNKIKLWTLSDLSSDQDYDGDGMSDYWEELYGLDRTKFSDKFNDPDYDGLINSLEFYLGTNATNNDSDTDTMLDGWEWFMGLNPLKNDSNEDSDNDGIPNWYEFQHDLHPTRKDGIYDRDNDGMSNFWEFNNDLSASDPTDANEDPDRDWVRNIDEFRGGSDPHNFFSVPRVSLSILHIFGLIILFSVTSSIFLLSKKNQRKNLIAQLEAPDYIIARKIQKASLPNYSAFKQAELEAQAILQIGDSLFNQGVYSEAVQQYKLALTKFEWLQNDQLIAESVFKLSRLQVEMEELSSESIFLQQFPKRQKDEVIEGLSLMLQALLAEAEKEWKRAGIAWQHAFEFQALEPQYQILCQSKVIENKVKSWLNNPTGSIDNNLLQSMEKWQQECQTKQYPEGLCSLLFLRARIELASFQLDEVEEWLTQCERIAEENGLKRYQILVQTERARFIQYKRNIADILEVEKKLTPQKQMELARDYLRKATQMKEIRKKLDL
ncbi:MAG: WD40 domain-containing protein, partial [Candidatus Hodarchaeales archaeon]